MISDQKLMENLEDAAWLYPSVAELIDRYNKKKEEYGDLNIKILQLEAELNNKKKELEEYGDHNCHLRHFGRAFERECLCGFSEVCKASGIPDKA